MDDVLSTINTRHTPQDQPADPRQERNAAGGYTFVVDDLMRLRRFLILGSEATYYASAKDLTRDNATAVIRMAQSDPDTLIRTIVDVSLSGAAPRQNPTLFALAIAASLCDAEHRAQALAVLPQVARTGTHLFLFARYVEQFRGWGRSLRTAVGAWYTGKTADQLAYQAVKYRQREGWSHRDLLRLAHPETLDEGLIATFDWITHETLGEATPRLISGFVQAQAPGAKWARLVDEYQLTWEMLPDEALASVDVWDALLDVGIPQTALMRQLPRLTRLGLLPAIGGRTKEVARQLSDPDRLRKARVHPVNVLVAQRTYASGHGARGQAEWRPTRRIVDALDAAFYAAFDAVEPSGKRTLLALDVSGSMTSPISNMPLSCREASAALALVQMATEPEVECVGFTGTLTPLAISPRQRLDDAIGTVSRLPFGATDCALPMVWAAETKRQIDTFVIYTDNETWYGHIHPDQALCRYRELTGIDAQLIVVGMTSTRSSIADPSDPGMLDVVGFDQAVPTLIADFSRGL
jgi:60 kDa SS-A/Ro ribonucleoprotein